MSLNIFEPRYRLLIRRCLEGSRRFGLATVNRNHELQRVACEVEISECQAAPDGRFLIDIVGMRRFRVLNAWEQVESFSWPTHQTTPLSYIAKKI